VNSQRFDTMAKSLAAWTSRRTFLRGVAGVAAGSALLRSATASAQGTTPAGCVQPADPKELEASQNESSDALKRLPPLDGFRYPAGSTKPIAPQFFDFVSQVQDLFTQGSHAMTDPCPWTLNRRELFLSQTTGLISAISVGAADAFFTDENPQGTPSALRTFPDLTPKKTKKPTQCTSKCLETALSCKDRCGSDRHCVYHDCYLPFIDCYVGMANQAGCLAAFFNGCPGDCYYGGS
jgi:hypothetical protein